jgi:hypothetical protein
VEPKNASVRRESDADPSFRRAAGIAAVLLAASYLIFSAVFSHLAPLGSWMNEIFGVPAWSESDPGGPYVDAAHQLVWGDGQLFEGHPGTVLVLLLSGLQHTYYALAGSGAGFSFTEFTARNLPTVFVLSKLMMTILHLLACFVCFVFAKSLLRDERAAALATFGYATSLPVGYYLSRISVEPLVVICFALSLLAIWRYQALALGGRLGSALGLAALSAAAAVSGTVTKFNFLAPLLPFLAFYVVLGGRGETSGPLVAWRTRALALLTVTATAVGLGLFYSQLIDWEGFFRLWTMFTQPNTRPPLTLRTLLPGFTARGAFLLCELVYIILGLAGMFAFLRGNSEQRTRGLWVSAWGGWGLLLFGYRIKLHGTLLPFHYFHLSNIVFAVFFGYALTRALRRLHLPTAGWRAAVYGLLGVALIHAATFLTVVDSRRRDAALYEPSREIHRVIAELGPGQRLACIRCARHRKGAPAAIERLFPLSSVGWTTGLRPEASSRLASEFQSLFVPVKAADLDPGAERIRVTALGTEVVVLEGPANAEGPARGEPLGAGLQ